MTVRHNLHNCIVRTLPLYIPVYKKRSIYTNSRRAMILVQWSVTHQQRSLLNLVLCPIEELLWQFTMVMPPLWTYYHYAHILPHCCWKIGINTLVYFFYCQLVFLQSPTLNCTERTGREKWNKNHLILLNMTTNHICVRVVQRKKRYNSNTNTCKSATQLFSNRVNQI